MHSPVSYTISLSYRCQSESLCYVSMLKPYYERESHTLAVIQVHGVAEEGDEVAHVSSVCTHLSNSDVLQHLDEKLRI